MADLELKMYCKDYSLECFGFVILRGDHDIDLGRIQGRCMNDRNYKCPLLNFIEEPVDFSKIDLTKGWSDEPGDIRKDILYALKFQSQLIEGAGEDELNLVVDLMDEGQLIFTPLHRRMKRNITGRQSGGE